MRIIIFGMPFEIIPNEMENNLNLITINQEVLS